MGKQKLNRFFRTWFNIELHKAYPRESTRFAKEHFDGKDISVAEIGTFEGENAVSIINTLNVNVIYLIDPYEDYEDYKADNSAPHLNKAERLAHARLDEAYGCVWLKKYSSAAKDKFQDESIDFIYIDGNHYHPYVDDDIEDYWKKVKKGGILAGHDIQAKDVCEAVMDFVKKNNLNLRIGDRRDWWIVKE